MQVDNSLRFFATSLVEDSMKFFQEYLKGTHIRNMQDRLGNKMNDFYLATKLDQIYPGIKNLYNNTSGFVHFSNEHSFLQTSMVADKERTIGTTIGNYDFFQIDKKVDFSYNMLIASEILFSMLQQWAIQRCGS
jgi:hypothetical protein